MSPMVPKARAEIRLAESLLHGTSFSFSQKYAVSARNGIRSGLAIDATRLLPYDRATRFTSDAVTNSIANNVFNELFLIIFIVIIDPSRHPGLIRNLGLRRLDPESSSG